MPGVKVLSKSGFPEGLLNLLYNIGFRLTGNHRDTTELVKCTINLKNRDRNGGATSVLKCMCSVFMENHLKFKDEFMSYGNNGGTDSDNGAAKIQAALLSLSPAERLLVVLRDVTGLDYSEISGVTGLEKTEVKRLLAAARWSLRERLLPIKRNSGEKVKSHLC